MKPNFSLSREVIITLIAIFLIGIAIMVSLVILAFLFSGNIPQVTILFPPTRLVPKATHVISTQAVTTQANSTSAPTGSAPAAELPTGACSLPSLALDASTFQIQNLTPASDGSLIVPADSADTAYWVEGTDTNYVFVLSPAPENLSILSATTAGSTAAVTLANCHTATYSLSAPQQGSLNASISPDQSTEGITLFFQTDSFGAGMVFQGDLAEETFTSLDTPSPDESGILAEVALLETAASSDGRTIQIGVSIYNYGQTSFTVTASDLSLSSLDAAPLALLSSEPSLPKEIPPGATQTFHLTFPRPASPTATLKIFTIEYDIEGY